MSSVHSSPTAMYDRVLREAQISYGSQYGDAVVERAARDAVDEFIVRKSARVTTFVPVLAMRRLRESLTTSSSTAD